MKFEKLVIENFSSFFGKHTIVFHTSTDKPITVIVGGNGKGKTSVFDALNWALYGENYEPVLENESQKYIQDFVNATAMKDAIINDSSVEMAATLNFEHDGKHYRIQHAICVKESQKKLHITDRTSSLIEFHESGNVSQISFIDSFLNEILPSNVRDYFLFNGDRINRLALPGASKEIQEGIYRVVDLELLQNGISHLNEIARKYRKLAKDASVGDLAQIEEQYTQAFLELDDLKKKIVNNTEEKRKVEDHIEVISEKLRGMDDVKKYQARRDFLKSRINQLTNSHKSIAAQIRANVAVSVESFALPDVDNLMGKLSEKRKKGEIPSSISESLLTDILEIKRCICGTEFTEFDHIYNNIQRRLVDAREKEKTGQGLIDLYFELSTAKAEIIQAHELIAKLEQDRTEIERELVASDKEFKEILEKLVGAPVEDIANLAQKLREYSDDLVSVNLSIQQCQYRVNEKEEIIRKLKTKREEMGEKQEKVRKYQLRDNLAQKSADELSRLFDKFAEESRNDIQDLTSKTFSDFIPTASSLKVGIDSAFHYDVRDENGNPALQQLSQGQKQALSFAYITSISKVSEKEPPLVIDYPLGRMDFDVQLSIAKRLPFLGSQIILLVLPGTEWNKNTEDVLRPYSSDIYELSFDNEKRLSDLHRTN